MKKVKRDSRVELLRIICMFCIIMGHFVGQGGGKDTIIQANRFFVIYFCSAARIATNAFLIIGCWFMVDLDFKAERIVRTWYKVISYAVPISAVMLLINPSIGNIVNLIKAFFPVFARPLWFASAYIVLMFLAPFLNTMLASFTKKQQAVMIGILSLPCCLAATIIYHEDFLNSLIWFIFVYVTVSFIKHYLREYLVWKSSACFLVTAIIYFGLCTVVYIFGTNDVLIGGRNIAPIATVTAQRWLSDMKALPNIVASLALFFGFYNLKCKKIDLPAAGG